MTVSTLDFLIKSNITASLDAFVTVHDFFYYNSASLGTKRISCNYGTSGSGMNYRGSSNSVGNNCWAVFNFEDAKLPFSVLIQAATGSDFPIGDGPGFPAMLWGNNAVSGVNNYHALSGGLGIAIALRLDKESPWAGTTNNDGYDIKFAKNDINVSEVWKGDSSQLYVWPRSNSWNGMHQQRRENLMQLVSQNKLNLVSDNYFSIFGSRDEISFYGNDAFSWYGFTFGPIERHESSVNKKVTIYGCINKPKQAQNNNAEDIFPLPQIVDVPKFVWGSISGSSDSEGGVMSPFKNGGVRGFVLDVPQLMMSDIRFHPNTCYVTSTFDLLYPHVVAFESPRFYGSLGFFKTYQLCYNVPQNTLSDGLLVLSGNGISGSIKTVIPWSGSLPRSGLTRTGRKIQ